MQPDLFRFFDAVYALDRPLEVWLRGVAEALRPFIDQGFGVGAWLTDITDPSEVRITTPVLAGAPSEWFDELMGLLNAIPAPAHHALHRVGPVAYGGHVNEVMLRQAPAFELYLDAHWRRRFHEERRRTLARGGAEPGRSGPARLVESLGILALDATGHGCAFGAPMDRLVDRLPTAAEIERWSRLTGHIANAYRLKRALDAGVGAACEAVVSPAGRVEHAEADARTPDGRTRLRQAALDVERARTRGRLQGDEVTALWSALVQGRWSLLETFDRGGRRYYVARRNEPVARPVDVLTAREAQVARYAALGHANKMIGYELGLATSTVANHLARAARKLGVDSRAALIRAVLAADAPKAP